MEKGLNPVEKLKATVMPDSPLYWEWLLSGVE